MYNDVIPAEIPDAQLTHEPEEQQILLDAYEGAIAYLDSELNRLFENLRARGALENTIVVLTSDHGESFGEQAPEIIEHTTSLYLPTLWVPLMIATPGPSPVTGHIESTVGIRAIPGTPLDMVGIRDAAFETAPRLAGLSDVSSAPNYVYAQLIRPEVVGPGHLAEHGTMRTVADDSLQYIRRARGEEELFDHRKDQWQLNDLATDPSYGDVISVFRASLREMVGATPKGTEPSR